MMNANQRLIFGVLIVLVDLLVFALPLTALFAGYILIARPPWFPEWVKRIYEN